MKKIILGSALLMCAVLFAACNASKTTVSNTAKWLPNDFDPKGTILLVEEYHWLKRQTESHVQFQQTYLSEHYPYKFEIVPLETIKSRKGKYADTKLYRYGLVSDRSERSMYRSDGASTNTGAMKEISYDFRFYDRENDKPLATTGRSLGTFKRTFQLVINTMAKQFSN